MKKIAIALSLLLCAAPAFAQDGSLYYSWNNCFGDAGATTSVNFDCAGGAPATSFASFEITKAGGAPQVVALSAVLDLAVAGVTALPTFWHMESGGCNDGGVSVEDARGAGLCTTANSTFQGSAGQTTDAFVTAYLPEYGGVRLARVLVAVVRASSNPFDMVQNQRYWGFKLNWLMDASTEIGGACVGCTAQAGMALNSILLEAPMRASGGEVIAGVITSGDAGSSPSTCMNNTTCESVPVQARTWGQLKSLYR